jgi:hypothetical protein
MGDKAKPAALRRAAAGMQLSGTLPVWLTEKVQQKKEQAA